MQKLYYSISQVSKEVDEESHILRYWEKEFTQLSPKKNNGGNRIYTDDDLKIIRQIKSLIREEQLSLKGAKEKMNLIHSKKEDVTAENGEASKVNDNNEISLSKEDLLDLKNTLSEISNFLKQ